MSNQTMGNTAPQNESVVCVETSSIYINKEKEQLYEDAIKLKI